MDGILVNHTIHIPPSLLSLSTKVTLKVHPHPIILTDDKKLSFNSKVSCKGHNKMTLDKAQLQPT